MIRTGPDRSELATPGQGGDPVLFPGKYFLGLFFLKMPHGLHFASKGSVVYTRFNQNSTKVTIRIIYLQFPWRDQKMGYRDQTPRAGGGQEMGGGALFPP